MVEGGGRVIGSKSDDWKFIIIVHKLIRKLISCIVGIVVVLKIITIHKNNH